MFALDRLVANERARYDQTKHPRPMILVNSSSAFWDAYVLTQFDCSYTTVHSRVRRATVKLVAEGDHAALQEELARAHRLMRWSSRGEPGQRTLTMRPGETVEVTDLYDYGGFGGGWAVPETTGIWTEGERAELRIAVQGADSGDYQLGLSVAMLCVEPDETLRVDVEANDVQITTRRFTGPTARHWRIDLPADAVRDDELAVTLLVDSPRSPVERGWSADERRLGVHVHQLTLQRVDRSLALGEMITFDAGSDAERLLGNGWSSLEPTGVWTEEETARLAFRLTDAPVANVCLVLDIEPFVTAEHRAIDTEIWLGAQRIASHTFRYGDPQRPLHIDISSASIDSAGGAVLEFKVREPARPVDLGVGSDPRRLGVHLRSLIVVEAGTVVEPDAGARAYRDPGTFAKLRSQLGRSLRS
jgi:hypothetical protein